MVCASGINWILDLAFDSAVLCFQIRTRLSGLGVKRNCISCFNLERENSVHMEGTWSLRLSQGGLKGGCRSASLLPGQRFGQLSSQYYDWSFEYIFLLFLSQWALGTITRWKPHVPAILLSFEHRVFWYVLELSFLLEWETHSDSRAIIEVRKIEFQDQRKGSLFKLPMRLYFSRFLNDSEIRDNWTVEVL